MDYSTETFLFYEILNLIDCTIDLFQEDHITQSVDYLNEVYHLHSLLETDECKQLIESELQQDSLQDIRIIGDRVSHFLEFIGNQDIWKDETVVATSHNGNKDNIYVSTAKNSTTNSNSNTTTNEQKEKKKKKEEQSQKGHRFFKTRGNLYDIDMMSAVATLLENQLYHTWMPLCANSEDITTTCSNINNINNSKISMISSSKTEQYSKTEPNTASDHSQNSEDQCDGHNEESSSKSYKMTCGRIIVSKFNCLWFEREALLLG